MTKAHFVNHTHWDREWYFTTEDARVLSDQLFSDALCELEHHPEATFTLDGQVSIVDEYLQLHPTELARIRNLVARKQLFIGPWFTQTDALIPDSESIIRNLVIGIKETQRRYGQPMMIGYLPDTFGFNAQLPMLLNQVGIHDFISWRGINFKRQVDSVYFKWQGLGSAQVYAASFPLGYYTGQLAVESKHQLREFVKNRLDPGIEFEAQHGQNAEVLLPSGIDQMDIVHNVSASLKAINDLSQHQVFISSYPQFMKTLHERADLKKYAGELRLPTYARVHRTIGSVRSRLKRQNFELEQIILKRVEPLAVIAQKCGISISNGLLLRIWKKLLENHAHDTLGGSVSDNVAVDIEHRFKQGFEAAAGVENLIKKRLAQRLKLAAHQVLVFNTETRAFSGYKDVQIISATKNLVFAQQYKATILRQTYVKPRKNIMQQTAKGFEFNDEPGYYKLVVRLFVEFTGLGYQVIDFTTGSQQLPAVQPQKKNEIQNESWQITYTGTGFDLKNADHLYKNAVQFVDEGNDGDTYDFSPVRADHELELPLVGTVSVVESPVYKQIEVKGTWELPRDLAERGAADPQTAMVAYRLRLTLTAADPVISGSLELDNQVVAHRLRLKLKTGINNEEAVAQIQGGFRKTHNLPISENWEQKFVEKPVNIYNFDKIVGMNDGQHGLFFCGKGEKEYELRADTLLITLMATTGQLGKPNLLWRPGRASGDTTSLGHKMTPTPAAQELGKNVFEFGIYGTQGAITENELALQVERWLTPTISYQLQQLDLFANRLDNKIWEIEFEPNSPVLSKQATFLKLAPAVVVTAVYPAYTIPGRVVVRLSNQGDEEVQLSSLQADFLLTNALEERLPETAEYVIKPYDMVTLISRK
ncbi:alpha-mannosidase [Liquorilactobacillus satsumensis]|uniref:alpha-mannosidase n=1 Tax=Liquorilactobacillus satsumensis TaxID=259059 RepID=UPI0021C2E54F|nr:glycoside hydrolase family 38 C-terminal domain-containing protein [Liquorilactobacillus satsumensis]MCP9328506.1 alpha-mannosidase [Liquorilactobacillus satsumensis]